MAARCRSSCENRHETLVTNASSTSFLPTINTGVFFFPHTLHGVGRMPEIGPAGGPSMRYSFQVFYPERETWNRLIKPRIDVGERVRANSRRLRRRQPNGDAGLRPLETITWLPVIHRASRVRRGLLDRHVDA